ncbi:VacJ family lipoprotein [Sulfurimonas sp.]|uniref:MlaA family lipoprotein n=1 Tax=Sulfurimonas sp. TaxID=2022749 RepID=UPI002A367120|nr:VacJ family lipoprotein [Sulfurimonas sp.]MDY0123192.1 VacJ family lipoprotein [Sulfurimonas sp.]
MRSVYFAFVITLVLTLTGCSSKSVEKPNEVAIEQERDDINGELEGFADEFEVEEVYDPFSGYNRAMTTFNDKAYEFAIKPVAKGYKWFLHEDIRESVDNFFKNIYFPMRFVNNVLQGKMRNAAEESVRFVVNSTAGVLGLFDPAKKYCELEPHDEDFGQTLGFYGVGSGPHIVLPLLGPSNVRDLIGMYPDSYLSPLDYTQRSYDTLTDTPAEYIGAKTLEKVNYVSLNIDWYDDIKRDAVDLYPYLRDMYEQYRDKQIKE